MPSPFEIEAGSVLLQEPLWSREGVLRAQLLDESYPKPFVIDDGQRRYLYFNVRLMQSAMRLAAPNELDLRYTQAMMAFLLFLPRPKRVLLIGLGGGSIVKFCLSQLSGCSVTAVELNPAVIAWREAFLLPPDGDRLSIIEADGAAYLEEMSGLTDVLMIDAFDETGFAPALASRAFFERAFCRLQDHGVLVVNLAGERESYEGLIAEVRHVFDEQVILMAVPEDGNHILFAFKERAFEPRWRWLNNHAKELRARHRLDFPAFVQKLERSFRQGLAGRY